MRMVNKSEQELVKEPNQCTDVFETSHTQGHSKNSTAQHTCRHPTGKNAHGAGASDWDVLCALDTHAEVHVISMLQVVCVSLGSCMNESV